MRQEWDRTVAERCPNGLLLFFCYSYARCQEALHAHCQEALRALLPYYGLTTTYYTYEA